MNKLWLLVLSIFLVGCRHPIAGGQVSRDLELWVIPAPIDNIMISDPQLMLEKHGKRVPDVLMDTVLKKDGEALSHGTYQVFRIPNNGRTEVVWTGHADGNGQIFLCGDFHRIIDLRDKRYTRVNHSWVFTIERPPEERFLYIQVNCTNGSIYTDCLSYCLVDNRSANNAMHTDANSAAPHSYR